MTDDFLRQSGIYCIRNISTNRRYVGSAVRVDLRLGHHRRSLKRGDHHSTYLQRSWNKRGPDDFVFEVIEFVPDKKSLIEREQFWIDHYQSSTRQHGYNLSPTAGSSLGIKLTPEARQALSKIKIESGDGDRLRKLTRDQEMKRRAGISKASRSMPDQVKEKIRHALKGRNRSAAHVNSLRRSRARNKKMGGKQLYFAFCRRAPLLK